jgi:hypothetical protein
MRRFLTAAAVLCLIAVRADAGLVQITDASGLGAGDTTAAYTGADGAIVTAPYVLSAGGNTLTYTEVNGSQFLRQTQGSSFSGNFAPGTAVLDTSNGGGPVDISFGSAVGEVGLGAQSIIFGTHTFTITAFDGTENLGSFDVGGDGHVSFLGVRATGTDVITSIEISSDDNNFAMAEASFGTASVSVASPEPSTLISASIAGLAGVGVAWRKRRRGASVA